jgi:flavorubredoxin
MHGRTGCNVSVADFADRPPRTLADGEAIVIGRRRIRYLDTPHVPHGWDAGVIFEESTNTLFCGDLFAHYGRGPAVTTADIIEAAIETERASRSTSLGPTTAPTIRKLSALKPQRLAVMHGSSFVGDGAKALGELAGYFDQRLREEQSAQA